MYNVEEKKRTGDFHFNFASRAVVVYVWHRRRVGCLATTVQLTLN